MVFEDPLGDESKELRLQRGQKAKGPNEVKMSWYYIQAVFHTTHTHTHLLLLFNDDRELCVWDLRVQLTSHQSGTFIILDVADIFGFRYFDFFGETLQGKSVELSGCCATKLFNWLLSASQYHCTAMNSSHREWPMTNKMIKNQTVPTGNKSKLIKVSGGCSDYTTNPSKIVNSRVGWHPSFLGLESSVDSILCWINFPLISNF